jgi:hypothetical protein
MRQETVAPCRARCGASIAIVKDVRIYLTASTAVIFIPIELGGFSKIFAAVPRRICCWRLHGRLQRLRDVDVVR